MNAVELRSLAAEPLITLGAHTITHCDLDYRNQQEQAAEIDGSRQQLKGFIGREVEHGASPHCLVRDWNGREFAQQLRRFFRG